jgi:hypothetical protein
MPAVTSIKRKKTVSLIAVILIVFSAIGALLPAMVSGDDENEESKIWGQVVEHTTGVSIMKATVYLYNVHTGDKFSYELEEDRPGYFQFIGYYGYFMLEVVPKDVTSPVKEAYLPTDHSTTEIFLVEMEDTKGPYYNFEGVTNPGYLTLEKVPPTPRKTFYVEGMVKDEFGDPVPGATVTITSNEFSGLEFKTTTITSGNMTGNYNITAFNSTYDISVTAIGYTYSNITVSLNQTLRNKNITLKSPQYIITGQALDKDGKEIKNVNIFLFDVNSDDYIHKESPISFFNIKIKEGTYKLVVDADGYKPYIHNTDIVITDSNKGYTIPAFTMEKSSEEKIMTEITFPDSDFNKTHVKTTWTLNADSNIYGLEWVDVGGPRYQIDKQFGNADLNVDAAEMVDFNDWLKARGPYRLYTEDFLEVNDTYFNPTLSTFKSTPSGYTGAVVGNTGTMKITTEMTYTHSKGFTEWAYKVVVSEFRDNEKIKITFPSDFEIITKFDDEIATLDNFHTININYSETPVTIKLSEIKGPVASIDLIKPKDYVATEIDVYLDASDSTDPIGEIENYTWDFDDGSMSYDEEVSHNWTTSGIKNVTLTIIDSSDLVDTDYILITVDDTNPTPDILLQNETGATFPSHTNSEGKTVWEVDEDETVTFNASKSTDTIDGTEVGKIASYLWNFGDEESGQSNQNVTEHIYGKPGSYDISLNVTDSADNYKKIEIILDVKDVTKPHPAMEPNSGQIDVGENFTISAEGTTDNFDDLDNLTFYWDLDINKDENGDGIKDNDYIEGEHGPKYNYSTSVYHAPITVLVNVTDQADNWRNITGYFTVKGMDLKLQEGKIKVSPSSKVEVGEKVNIEVNVTNKGVDAENIVVTFYVDGAEKDRKDIEFIEEDGFEVVTFSWKAKGEDKTHVIKINVTTSNTDAEEFWQDNEYEYKIKVVPGEIDPLCYVVVVVVIVIVVAILIYRKRTYGTFDIRPRKKSKSSGKKKKKKEKEKEKPKKKGKEKSKKKK